MYASCISCHVCPLIACGIYIYIYKYEASLPRQIPEPHTQIYPNIYIYGYKKEDDRSKRKEVVVLRSSGKPGPRQENHPYIRLPRRLSCVGRKNWRPGLNTHGYCQPAHSMKVALPRHVPGTIVHQPPVESPTTAPQQINAKALPEPRRCDYNLRGVSVSRNSFAETFQTRSASAETPLLIQKSMIEKYPRLPTAPFRVSLPTLSANMSTQQ